MVETNKLSSYRLSRVLITIGILGIALAVGVYYWPGIRLGATELIQQMTRIQQRLASVNYTIYKRITEQQWARQILVERDWLVKSWLIWGGLIGVILPVIVFLLTYGSHWWRLVLPPSPSRDSEDWWIARLIQRKVIQTHWRTNWFNLEQAVLNVLLLGLSCFGLQLVIHSYILISRPLVRAGLLSFIAFSYACFFFYLYIRRCSLRQAASMLDDKLRLKQELITSLDIQPFKHSRLGHFLLTDTAIKLRYKSVPQLFPYHPHRIRIGYFLLQLGLILLAALIITLVGPQLVSSYYTEKGAHPIAAERSVKIEGLISQQAQQIRVLSHKLEQHLPPSQLPGAAGELGQLAHELLILGDQSGAIGMAGAGTGYNSQGVLIPQGNQLAVSGTMASLTPPPDARALVVEEPGLGASAGIIVSPEEMRGLIASFGLPLIPQTRPESSKDGKGGGGLSRISDRLAQIAQRLGGLNGGETPLKPGANANSSQGGEEAKEGAGNDSSPTTLADRLDQLAHRLQQAQVPSSAQAIKHNLWLKGEQLAQLAQRLSQWEAAERDAQTAATEDNASQVADRSFADLSEQQFGVRMVSFELSQSAQRLKEWDAIIQRALSQQERLQLIPYGGQYGPGEASIVSGKRNQPFSSEVSSQPKLRTGGESTPHSHAQLTNVSLNNSSQETTTEGQQSRRAIIARGYNQGSSSHPAQVKLGQGQRDQPLGGVAQTAPNPGMLANSQRMDHSAAATSGKELFNRERQRFNPNESNYDLAARGGEDQNEPNRQMATNNPNNQYRAWMQWGKELELASLTLAELANNGIMANTNQPGERRPAYQPQVESAALNHLGNKLGQLSARLYNQFNARRNYTAPAAEGIDAVAEALSEDRGEPGITQGLNRLQNQTLGQLAEGLGSLSQDLLGLAYNQQQTAEANAQPRQLADGGDQLIGDERYELLRNLAQDLGLISRGLIELDQLSHQTPLKLQGVEDRQPGGELAAVEEPVRGSWLLPDSSGSTQEYQQRSEDAGQVGDVRQQAGETPTKLREWANQLDWLSTELAHLAKDDRERRLLAKRQLNFRNYQSDDRDQMSMDQALDPQNKANQNRGSSRVDDIPGAGESQPINLKLSKGLQKLAAGLKKLAKNRNGTDGWLESKTIIENGIQEISQASSELKRQADPPQQLDRITDELDQLAKGLSQLQPFLPIRSLHLGRGAQPTTMEQIPSPQTPLHPTDGGVDPAQIQDGNQDRQSYISAFSQPQSHSQDRIKQQLALMKLDELIGKLRQQQVAQAASDNTPSGKGTTGFIDQHQTDFSKGVDQQDELKGGSELEHTPREGVISGPYPMEEDLTQDEVFERIIHRLEESRNRIAQFAVPSLPLTRNLPGQLKSRKGNFPQPPNLPGVRGLTQWEEQQGVLRRKIAKPPSPFPPNQLISFREPKKMGEYAKVSIRTQVSHIGSYNHQPKPALSLPGAGQLSFPADQEADNSVRQQLIPQGYQQIIRQLYQPD